MKHLIGGYAKQLFWDSFTTPITTLHNRRIDGAMLSSLPKARRRKMARPRTRRPVNNPGNPLPQPEQEADRFARTNDVVISAGKAYADAREAWKRAVAELEASDPCAANHPSKVTAAILAFGNYLEAAKEVQARCKKS